MSAAVVLLIFAEAAGTCGAVAPDRLGGEAHIAPAILEFEPDASERSALTLVGAWQGIPDKPADLGPETHQPPADPATLQCKAMPTVIA